MYLPHTKIVTLSKGASRPPRTPPGCPRGPGKPPGRPRESPEAAPGEPGEVVFTKIILNGLPGSTLGANFKRFFYTTSLEPSRGRLGALPGPSGATGATGGGPGGPGGPPDPYMGPYT